MVFLSITNMRRTVNPIGSPVNLLRNTFNFLKQCKTNISIIIILHTLSAISIIIILHTLPLANNESPEVFDIIKPGRRVKIKGHRQENVNNF